MKLEDRVKRITPRITERFFLVTLRCCKEWTVAAMHPLQRCGICKQVPR